MVSAPTPEPGWSAANFSTAVCDPWAASRKISLSFNQVPTQAKRLSAVSEYTSGTRMRSTTLFVVGSIRATSEDEEKPNSA
jgi:hypothetical protein